MCVHACVQANMLTCAHGYTHTRLHACSYMIARLYCLICNLYNTIVFTCLLTNLRCTEDSNRTVLGGQYSVGTGNVAIASVGENPRPQPVLPYAETKFTSLLRRRQLLRCLREEHPASPSLTRTTATFGPGHATHMCAPENT